MPPYHDGKTRADGIVRLLVVDDHALVRKGLVRLLDSQPDFQVVGEAADGNEAVAQAEFLLPDVILMDVDMPNVDGVEATRRIKQRHRETVIVGVSLHAIELSGPAMAEAGAEAYVSKEAPAQAILESIRQACRRKPKPA